MTRLLGRLSLILLFVASSLARSPNPPVNGEEPKELPWVYPSTTGGDSRWVFTYVPGNITISSKDKKAEDGMPAYDKNTAQTLHDFCKDGKAVTILASPEKADYIIFYSVEFKRDITAVRSDGQVIRVAKSFWRKRDVVQDACTAIRGDWSKHPYPHTLWH